jgi:Photosynthetic reaction centre cytochrome C subunit
MNVRRAVTLMLSCALFNVAMNVASSGQSPETPAPKTGTLKTNLTVLPRNMSAADIVQLMARYTQELGVQCAFCHVENPQTQQVDFASNENPRKQIARIMIGMLGDINNKYLPQVGDRRYAAPISCGNCHQGQTYPPVFEPRPQP